MAYSKTTWSSGDTITAAKLNNMESGIAGNADDITAINQSISELNTNQWWTKRTTLTSSDNIDTLGLSDGGYGMFWFGGSGDLGGTLPFTSTTGFQLLAFYRIQFAIRYNTGEIKARVYANSVWNTWTS